MNGHWQREVPKQSGNYWTASSATKRYPGEVDRIRLVLWGDKKLLAGGEWNGWWWSEPAEYPPDPPAWEAEP